MAYRNYDMVKDCAGKIFLTLGSKYYWLNKPGISESRARSNLPSTTVYPLKYVGNLRNIVRDKTVACVEEEDEEDEEVPF